MDLNHGLNTAGVSFEQRKGNKPKIVLTESDWKMMQIVNEFRLATVPQITRLLKHNEQTIYTYRRMHALWLNGYFERFKVYAGSIAGMPNYYVLGKEGVAVLRGSSEYDSVIVKGHSRSRKIINWQSFQHNCMLTEIASTEALINDSSLSVMFRGELGSVELDESNNRVKLISPDFTSLYQTKNTEFILYTEFERSYKENDYKVKKLNTYKKYLGEDTYGVFIRFIFPTETMELGFWVHTLKNHTKLLKSLPILSTNLEMLTNPQSFKENIYLKIDPSVLFVKKLGNGFKVDPKSFSRVSII
ncbi:replication-relaxation family protein [candidate division WWE3 bacterium]|uniref:Replication-relaxation family protein n=1 Tax=candidate division WWE3 bacterium TaxID=2053526 RepID=A0A955J2A0_UNCKA|nr:replication-relaxation family protein [candidate division WWE3 bacterium]